VTASSSASRRDDGERGFEPIDFVLKQGDKHELQDMRRQIGDDPLLALELADTVDLVEQFRQLRTEPSARFACKLAGLAVRAERRLNPSLRKREPAPPQRMPYIGMLAAAATFTGLLLWNPLGEDAAPEPQCDAYAITPRTDVESQSAPPLLRAEAEWNDTIEAIGDRLALERSPRLQAAFEDGLRSTGDRLSQWLDPRNTMVLLRLDHELRTNAQNRTRTLEQFGGLAAVDKRVQQLADGIAFDLSSRATLRAGADDRADDDRAGARAFGDQELEELAYGVRALIAAGSTAHRVQALRESGDQLAAELPHLHGGRLVTALSGLVELAAISGQHFEQVAEHGARLCAEVLLPDEERWVRSRPELLADDIAPSALGEAARIVGRLPAFGADVERCRLTRRLILGRLREQRDHEQLDRGQDRPEVLAAMLYGCGDLLEDGEYGRLQRQMQRWKPARLAPDYVTVQQIAWSLRPGDRGFTRRQWELRELAVLPIPADLQERAAFCLCLATNYAGFVGALVQPDDAAGRRPSGS